ncbi:MAG: LamG domain protein jellyroll fold domain protein [Verrucomicrobiales bacterium]|nr:LamG domain protein jellyroll fold domain protein [Verrucomicrobiales bacterium]
MKNSINFFRAARAILIASLVWCAFAASALDIQIGATDAAQGIATAAVPIQLANVTTNLSAIAFYVVNDATLGRPNITGLGQNNGVAFVDDFGGGVYRVTAFVLGNPGFANGTIFSLTYSLPSGMAIGSYPVSFLGAPPLNAPSGGNPEARANISSALIPSAGTGGLIRVIPPVASVVNGITLQTNGPFRLQFSGNPGWNYSLQISTNLIDWVTQTNLAAGTNGLFEFIDSNVINRPVRFYRLKNP